MQFDRLKRREFIKLLGGTATVWPLAAGGSRLELMQMNARFAAAMARAVAEQTQTEPPAQGTSHTRAWAHSGMKDWAA